MSKCVESDTGMHTFRFVPGTEVEPIVHEYLVCIACGERRAIGVLGDLMVREDRGWTKYEPKEHSE